MKLIEIITKDCAALDLHLTECSDYLDNILNTYRTQITSALSNASQPLYINDFSDFEWGAACHGTIPKRLANKVPDELRKKGKDLKTGKVYYYVEPAHTQFVLDLMRRATYYEDTIVYMYFFDVYNSVFYVDKQPFTWYALGKDVQKRLTNLPAQRDNNVATQKHFDSLPSSIKNMQLQSDIKYPSLLYNLPKDLYSTLKVLTPVMSTFTLFSHFEIHTHRSN